MNNNLYIPEKITIGFNNRTDTFTGKLAFIVYKDEKGKLKKEGSFNNWRNKNLEVLELDNNPESGFILNKDIHRGGHHFGNGRSVIRVYDSRNFEFEITPSNLLAILSNSDCTKNEIVEKCVYAWYGTELILLPVNSVEYKESIKFTKKQANKFSVRDLIVGNTYVSKKSQNNYVYLGYMFADFNEKFSYIKKENSFERKKKHVFLNLEQNIFGEFSSKDLSHCVNEEEYEDLDNVLKRLNDLFEIGKIKDVIYEPVDIRKEEIKDFLESNKNNEAYFYEHNSGNVLNIKQNRTFYFHLFIYKDVSKETMDKYAGIEKRNLNIEEQIEFLKDFNYKMPVGVFENGIKKCLFFSYSGRF